MRTPECSWSRPVFFVGKSWESAWPRIWSGTTSHLWLDVPLKLWSWFSCTTRQGGRKRPRSRWSGSPLGKAVLYQFKHLRCSFGMINFDHLSPTFIFPCTFTSVRWRPMETLLMVIFHPVAAVRTLWKSWVRWASVLWTTLIGWFSCATTSRSACWHVEWLVGGADAVWVPACSLQLAVGEPREASSTRLAGNPVDIMLSLLYSDPQNKVKAVKAKFQNNPVFHS